MTTTSTAPTQLRPNDPQWDDILNTIAEGAAARDLNRVHPIEHIGLLAAAGFGAVRIPVHLGGSGWSLSDLIGFVIRIAQADSNVAQSLRNHFTFVEGRLKDPENPHSRRWLTAAVEGRLFSGAATELAARRVGAQQIATTFTPDADGYRVSGVKYYSTGAAFADFMTTAARRTDGAIVTVIVPTDREGVIHDDDWDGFGQRLTSSGTTRFEHVRVEPDEILDIRLPETPRAPWTGSLSQLWLTGTIAGILHNIVGDGTELLRSRQRTYAHAATDLPADDPLLQQTIGDLASSAFAAEAIVLKAAHSLDARAADPTPERSHEASLQAAKAKVTVDRLAQHAATALFDVGGASATARAAGLDRHWRNIRTLSSHNPTALKAQAIGNHLVNGATLPTVSSFF